MTAKVTKIYGNWFDTQMHSRLQREKEIKPDTLRRAYLLTGTSFNRYWVRGYVVQGDNGAWRGYSLRTDGRIGAHPYTTFEIGQNWLVPDCPEKQICL